MFIPLPLLAVSVAVTTCFNYLSYRRHNIWILPKQWIGLSFQARSTAVALPHGQDKSFAQRDSTSFRRGAFRFFPSRFKPCGTRAVSNVCWRLMMASSVPDVSAWQLIKMQTTIVLPHVRLLICHLVSNISSCVIFSFFTSFGTSAATPCAPHGKANTVKS